MSETILKVQHLGKSFGNNEILKDIDFSVKPKDVTCIIGPSGSGKSTLLRCMNLLETPSCGEIRYHGTNIMDKHVNVPEYRSKVGMVFQNFNLFPHFNVLKNVSDAPIINQKRKKEETSIKTNCGEQFICVENSVEVVSELSYHLSWLFIYLRNTWIFVGDLSFTENCKWDTGRRRYKSFNAVCLGSRYRYRNYIYRYELVLAGYQSC